MYGSQTTYGPGSKTSASLASRRAAPSPAPHHTSGGSSNAYQSNAIMTASPGKLLLMLYDGAIRFCAAAEEGIATKDFASVNTNLVKAQDIIAELRMTLNYKPDHAFATKMSALYVFYEKELILANVDKNAKKVAWVRKHLTELRDTWSKVIKT